MSDGGIKVEQFQIPMSDPKTGGHMVREEMAALAAGILTLVERNQDGESHFGGAINRIRNDGMTLESIMIQGALAQKMGRHRNVLGPDLILGEASETNVLPFTGRRKRNPRSE